MVEKYVFVPILKNLENYADFLVQYFVEIL